MQYGLQFKNIGKLGELVERLVDMFKRRKTSTICTDLLNEHHRRLDECDDDSLQKGICCNFYSMNAICIHERVLCVVYVPFLTPH